MKFNIIFFLFLLFLFSLLMNIGCITQEVNFYISPEANEIEKLKARDAGLIVPSATNSTYRISDSILIFMGINSDKDVSPETQLDLPLIP